MLVPDRVAAALTGPGRGRADRRRVLHLTGATRPASLDTFLAVELSPDAAPIEVHLVTASGRR